MLPFYKIATTLISPLVPLWLRYRMSKGKEDKARIGERFGHSAHTRPQGTLLWIHAASVGESNSVLALIRQLTTRFPKLSILLTTGTVTSANLMGKQLPKGVLHHYAPIDTPDATERFIAHWYPDVVWFVESEFWPNLIDAAKRYFCLMAVVNARMSQRSFVMWKKYPNVTHAMFSAFRFFFAQSNHDAERLRELGAVEIIETGNIKYDAPPLSCNESELMKLHNAIGGRKVLLAASTHPGEEILIAKTHAKLVQTFPNLLTIIVPRHANRGDEIAAELSGFGIRHQRSKQQSITPQTNIYIADTMGELGLFYRLSQVVFMGGSLVAHGGQNPLEPARLSCAILTGPHIKNFAEIYTEMKTSHAVIMIADENALAKEIENLLSQFSLLDTLQTRAKQFVSNKGGASETIINLFAQVFEQ